jgi:hypothetical protein
MDQIDTSDEACALACILVSNPQGAMRKDGDGWQKTVNDLIRALRDERNLLRADNATLRNLHLSREAETAALRRQLGAMKHSPQQRGQQ